MEGHNVKLIESVIGLICGSDVGHKITLSVLVVGPDWVGGKVAFIVILSFHLSFLFLLT